jgi:5'-3' exoribonuclease 1
MHRLQQHLKYFVVNKISTDELWQGVNVILSGHETPGEGEHKIMDFIRFERSKKDYDPSTRHCLYGLDAGELLNCLLRLYASILNRVPFQI